MVFVWENQTFEKQLKDIAMNSCNLGASSFCPAVPETPTQSMVRSSTAMVLHESLLEMQNIGPSPMPTKSPSAFLSNSHLHAH